MSRTILSNTQLQALVNNLTTRVPKATFVVAEVTYSASKVVTLAKSVLTVRSAASAAKGKWVDARKQIAPVENEAIPIVEAARSQLVSMLSNDTGALANLAVSPRKKAAALTPEEKMVAAAKNRATRAARGTMGKKAKAKVKGNVTGITVTPVTSQLTPPVTAAASPLANPANDVAAVTPAPAVAQPASASLALAGGAPIVTGH